MRCRPFRALLLAATLTGCGLLDTPPRGLTLEHMFGPPGQVCDPPPSCPPGELCIPPDPNRPGCGSMKSGWTDVSSGWQPTPEGLPYGAPGRPYPLPHRRSCHHYEPHSGLTQRCTGWFGNLPSAAAASCGDGAFLSLNCPQQGVIAACLEVSYVDEEVVSSYHYANPLPGAATLAALATACTATEGRVWWTP